MKLLYYIGGDFNINLMKKDTVKIVKNFTDLTYYRLGCIPLISKPTRITAETSTLLDHMYTNNVSGFNKSDILVDDISDHLPVMVSCNLNIPKYVSDDSYIRDSKGFIMENFLEDLAAELQSLGLVTSDNIDQFTEQFVFLFQNTLNKHAPLRKRSRKEKKMQMKPCISKGILKSIQVKNTLHKRAIKDNTGVVWNQYKKYRNKLTHIKEFAKRQYFQSQVENSKHDVKMLWKTINQIVSLKNHAITMSFPTKYMQQRINQLKNHRQ